MTERDTEREAYVIEQLNAGLTLAEIALIMQITKQRVSAIANRAGWRSQRQWKQEDTE